MRLSPTRAAAAYLALIAAAALVLPVAIAVLAALALLAAVIADARSIPDPDLRRSVPRILSRGVPAQLAINASEGAQAAGVEVRQPVPAAVRIEPASGRGGLRERARQGVPRQPERCREGGAEAQEPPACQC